MLTLDSAFTVKFGAQHPQSKNQHGEWKDNSNAKADAPDGREMILPSDREDNKKNRTSQGTTKLAGIKRHD
jgi:hypothetical protein